MGLFYTASPKELLQIRNKIFLDHGLPALQKEGFQRSPYSTAWFGKSENVGFSYELCRLKDHQLEIVSVHIVRGDRAIQVALNIFDVQPTINSLIELSGFDGLQFHLPPNRFSEMRFRIDDIKGPPILDYNHIFRNFKLKSYYTKTGLTRRADELGEIIRTDLGNIDAFVKRWHQLHQPLKTTWEGHPIK